jgi:DeoR-like helix-turn-helix domain
MRTEEFTNFAGRKAFEIAYAVYRLSGYRKDTAMAKYMEQDSLIIMRETVEGNFADCMHRIKSLEYTARLGMEVGNINAPAGNMLLAELKSLQTAISKFETENEADLKSIFKRQSFVQEKAKVEKTGNQVINPAASIGANGNDGEIDYSYDQKGSDRQTAILNIIRQKGNCRLKEIQEGMRGVSERTIRYDVQRLLESGAIERVGGGGPFSYYRVFEGVVSPKTGVAREDLRQDIISV